MRQEEKLKYLKSALYVFGIVFIGSSTLSYGN